MTIHHIVLFKFKPTVSAQEVQAACDRMLALQTNCLHPETKQPYVKAAVGGKNNSPEGKSVGRSPGGDDDDDGMRVAKRMVSKHGFEHAFISQFKNEEDRRYYLESDQAHLAFVKSMEGLVDDAQVIDFTAGVF